MSDVTQSRLTDLETVIERGLATFVEVGEALIEIRGSRLYRFDYGTFEDYCRERWGFAHTVANQYMDAAKVVGVLTSANAEVLPTNEAQARGLAAVLRRDGPEAVRDTWTEVIERSEGRPTARVVREAIAEIIEEEDASRDEAPTQSHARRRITVTETRQHLRHIEMAMALLVPDEVVPAAQPVVLDALPRLTAWIAQWTPSMSPETSTETDTP